MKARVIAVIPARFASTRLPGKPLIDLDGKPMIVRVAERVALSQQIDDLIVATDDERIAAVVTQAGYLVQMTPSSCPSGTDRVQAAVALRPDQADIEWVVNVQGDEPLVDPRDIDCLIEHAQASPPAQALIWTLAQPFLEDQTSDASVVKVAVLEDGRAHVFSRGPVPGHPVLKHVGLYAYRPQTLHILARLPPSPREQAERLEQWRALDHGISIYVARCVSMTPSLAVDVPEDVDKVVRLLSKDKFKSYGKQ